MHFDTVQPVGQHRKQRLSGTRLTVPTCDHDICVTCSDRATTARVIELLPGGLARVEAGGSCEEICIDLVDAVAGDLVLVHAGAAIGKLEAGRLEWQQTGTSPSYMSYASTRG